MTSSTVESAPGATVPSTDAAVLVHRPGRWIDFAVLYIGTFGSFIGFASVFPKLIADQFPAYSTFQVASACLSLAFIGALVGSLARPAGGRLADRLASVTVAAFGVMVVGTLAVVAVLPLGNFLAFLGSCLLIFVATGIGNGSTYRMIPSVFSARSGVKDAHQNSAKPWS
ncbi:hypothetical protein [Cryobacterium aureum]|uniref:hypothetical protein n=1 Tax=Cryobacterium aureum TaxID=995037 RepID=UPI003F6D6A65